MPVKEISERLKNLKDGENLRFPLSVNRIDADCTSERFLHVSNNDASLKRIFALLENKRDITIDGNGATLTFSERITPFYLYRCKNIRLENFRIRFSNRYYFQAKIIASDENGALLEPLSCLRYKVSSDGKLTLHYEKESLCFGTDAVFIQQFEAEPVRVAEKSPIHVVRVGKEYERGCTFEETDGGLLFKGLKGDALRAGNLFCCFTEKRLADCIVIDECENIALTDIVIESSPAMGIVGQNSKNIFLQGVAVQREEGSPYAITTLADATHFVGCRGRIRMQTCTFENMNDDATNIHGIYAQLTAVDGDRAEVSIKHFQQQGIVFWRKGDKVRFLDQRGRVRRNFCVKACEMKNESTFLLTLDASAEGLEIGSLLENRSAYPSVRITDCQTGGNRPRGFLLATAKKAVVENCSFYNSECGVGVFADTQYWFEAGAVGRITVKNCRFASNYGGSTAAIEVKPTILETYGFYFNGKIIVKGNEFELSNGIACDIYNVKTVTLKDNRYTGAGQKAPIEINHCRRRKQK